MDNPNPRVRFVPDRRYTALAGGGVVVAVLAALVADSPPARLVALVAVAVLLAYVVSDLVFSPRLEADPAGLVVRSPMTRARLGWDEIDEVRADTRLRHGLRSTTLEIDADAVLIVLSRRSLGSDPAEAAGLINAFRPADPSPGCGADAHHDRDRDE